VLAKVLINHGSLIAESSQEFIRSVFLAAEGFGKDVPGSMVEM
jgi:hypothetical protein